MTDTLFGDGLIKHPFAWGNYFTNNRVAYYEESRSKIILYCGRYSVNRPYIFRSGFFGPDNIDNIELRICGNTILNDRIVSVPKIKEIMNSAKAPMRVKTKYGHYHVGKGFLAEEIIGPTLPIFTDRPVRLLFVACVNGNLPSPIEMKDVTFFIDRNVLYTDDHKAVKGAVRDFVKSHPGDIMIVNDISSYVGDKIPIPNFRSLSSLKVYNQQFTTFAVDRFFSI